MNTEARQIAEQLLPWDEARQVLVESLPDNPDLEPVDWWEYLTDKQKATHTALQRILALEARCAWKPMSEYVEPDWAVVGDDAKPMLFLLEHGPETGFYCCGTLHSCDWNSEWTVQPTHFAEIQPALDGGGQG